MNPLISAFCLVFSLSCQAPAVQQDSAGGNGRGAAAWDGTHAHSSSAGGNGFQQLSVSNESGALMLVLHGDDRVTAILDGELLPRERVVRDADHLKVTDADGETLFDIRVLPGNRGLAFPYDSSVLTSNGVLVSSIPGLLRGQVEESLKPRKMIGVTTVPLEPALAMQLAVDPEEAVVVSEVFDDMPAQKAGLQVYDVVLKIDGEAPVTSERLRDAIRRKEAGQELTLSLIRQGQPLELKVGVEEVSAEQRARSWGTSLGSGTYSLTGPGADAMAAYDLDQLRGLYAGNADDRDELAAAHDQMRAAHAEIQAQLEQLHAQLSQVSSDTERQHLQEAQDSLKSALERVAAAAETLHAQHASSHPDVGFLSGNDGSRSLFVPYPSGAGGSEAALKTMEERFAHVEERMKHLEDMLQRLVDSSGKPAATTPSEDKP